MLFRFSCLIALLVDLCLTADRRIDLRSLVDKFMTNVCDTNPDGAQIYLRVREYCRDKFLSPEDLETVKTEFKTLYGVDRPAYQLRPLLAIICGPENESKRKVFSEHLFGRTEEDFAYSNELIKVSSISSKYLPELFNKSLT